MITDARLITHLSQRLRNDAEVQARLVALGDNPSPDEVRIFWRTLSVEYEPAIAIRIEIENLPIVHVPRIVQHDEPKILQPGDMLARLIERMIGEVPGDCACSSRQEQMNQWGWWGCWKHRNDIIGWLCEEAANRGHETEPVGARALFVAVLKELRNRKQ
jgi:hypothetical protein